MYSSTEGFLALSIHHQVSRIITIIWNKFAIDFIGSIAYHCEVTNHCYHNLDKRVSYISMATAVYNKKKETNNHTTLAGSYFNVWNTCKNNKSVLPSSHAKNFLFLHTF